LSSNRTVEQVVEELLKHTGGSWENCSDPNAVHEASRLNLTIDKAHHLLEWSPTWSFSEAIAKTFDWYEAERGKKDLPDVTRGQIEEYSLAARNAGQKWARES
jgi:CDP-glucose 4,6-dehydratase